MVQDLPRSDLANLVPSMRSIFVLKKGKRFSCTTTAKRLRQMKISVRKFEKISKTQELLHAAKWRITYISALF